MNMKYITLFAAAILIVFIGFIFISRGENQKTNSNDSGFARGKVDSESKKNRMKVRERSLFEEDSSFLEFPEADIHEINSSELSLEERARRRKVIIDKSRKLAELFPNNSVIPRELTPEEAKKIADINQRMANVQNQYFQNEKVSKEDRLFYYNERLKTTKDRLEIFKYALGLENEGKFEEAKLEGFLKERFEVFVENEKAYSEEISKVEMEK